MLIMTKKENSNPIDQLSSACELNDGCDCRGRKKESRQPKMNEKERKRRRCISKNE